MQRVIFCLNSFTTSQILDWKKKQRVRFWIKTFSKCPILKNCLHSKNHILIHFTPWKRHFLHFSCVLKSMVLYWKLHYVSDFELEKIQRVRFWIEKKYNASDFEMKKNTTRQILNWKKYNASDFEMKKKRVRFWNQFFPSWPILI